MLNFLHFFAQRRFLLFFFFVVFAHCFIHQRTSDIYVIFYNLNSFLYYLIRTLFDIQEKNVTILGYLSLLKFSVLFYVIFFDLRLIYVISHTHVSQWLLFLLLTLYSLLSGSRLTDERGFFCVTVNLNYSCWSTSSLSLTAEIEKRDAEKRDFSP